MGQIITVNFRGDTLFAVENDDGVWLALKPVCDTLGLNWRKQRERILEDQILSEGCTMQYTPTPGGVQEMLCMKLDIVNGWFLSIQDKSIQDPAVREKVLAYKRECYAVLFKHFYGRTVDQRRESLQGEAKTEEPLNVRRQLVSEARQTHGIQAARELWFKLGLPTTPAMFADPRQSEFGFTYTAVERDVITKPVNEAA